MTQYLTVTLRKDVMLFFFSFEEGRDDSLTHSFVIRLQLLTRHKFCLQEIYNPFCEAGFGRDIDKQAYNHTK